MTQNQNNSSKSLVASLVKGVQVLATLSLVLTPLWVAGGAQAFGPSVRPGTGPVVTFPPVSLPSQGCQTPPSFSGISASQGAVTSKNNKPVDIVFSGIVEAGEGCTLSGTWYTLMDEYGELDGTQSIQVNADGTFIATVTILASRKGDDKDGRTYGISFGAENEAGVSNPIATSIKVSHDNRK